MLPVATQAEARAQLLRHFTGTLRALPAELALALWHPDLPKARFHDGVTLPANQIDADIVLFASFDIRYWVLGTTPETCDQYFDAVMRVWSDQGWPTRTLSTSRPLAGNARTPDGYGFSLTQSVSGYLSMAGSTPLFVAESDTGDPFPTRIDHPAASRN